jgi:hypothetical protein
MKKLLIALVLGTSLLLIQSSAFAQTSETPASGSTVSDQDIQLLRSDIRSHKKQIIAESMKLTDAEGAKFWPVYDAYTLETTKLGDASYALVKEYAQTYNDMTDAQADSLVNKMAVLDSITITLTAASATKIMPATIAKISDIGFESYCTTTLPVIFGWIVQ